MHISRRMGLNLVVLLVLLYVVAPQVGKFKSSVRLLEQTQVNWLLVALACALSSYLLASLMYCLLAKKPLTFGRTLLVQLASTFANRLLPAGVGAIGVNYDYLRKRQHTAAQAGAVVAANNTLGFVGHFALLGGALLLTRSPLGAISWPHGSKIAYEAAALAIAVAIIIFWFAKLRHSFARTVKNILKNLVTYRVHPLRLGTALLSSMALTCAYVLCLLACAAAVKLHIDFVQALIVLTAGVVSGTVTPTPGGLLGAEAGLVAGFVALGSSSADALAAVLLYRLLTYWLALLSGFLAFARARSIGYL